MIYSSCTVRQALGMIYFNIINNTNTTSCMNIPIVCLTKHDTLDIFYIIFTNSKLNRIFVKVRTYILNLKLNAYFSIRFVRKLYILIIQQILFNILPLICRAGRRNGQVDNTLVMQIWSHRLFSMKKFKILELTKFTHLHSAA